MLKLKFFEIFSMFYYNIVKTIKSNMMVLILFPKRHWPYDKFAVQLTILKKNVTRAYNSIVNMAIYMFFIISLKWREFHRLFYDKIWTQM